MNAVGLGFRYSRFFLSVCDTSEVSDWSILGSVSKKNIRGYVFHVLILGVIMFRIASINASVHGTCDR